MSDKIIIKASKRDVIGKKVKLLRLEGLLPAVVYGRAIDAPISISMDLRETTKIMRNVGPSTLVTLDVDGKEYATLVRARQRDFIKGNYLHLDFLAISMTEKVTSLVNLILEGVVPAIETFGAVLITGVDRIEISALPQDLPDVIRVDISSLENIGSGIFTRDLILPDNVELLSSLEDMIAVATAPTLAIEEEEEAVDEELLEGEEGEEAGEGTDDEASEE